MVDFKDLTPSFMDPQIHHSKIRLLDAALQVIRTKGYTAATVDDICAAAEVTKGSFFHHFKGKLDLALAAIDHWNAGTGALFANAPYQAIADPRERVLAYIDFRASLLQGALPDFTCLLGTMVQETFSMHPQLREACNQGIAAHALTVARDLAAARQQCAPDADWDPEMLGFYTQAVIQGAFVLAKAQGGAQIAAQCIGLLRTHVAGLLPPPTPSRRPTPTRGVSR